MSDHIARSRLLFRASGAIGKLDRRIEDGEIDPIDADPIAEIVAALHVVCDELQVRDREGVPT